MRLMRGLAGLFAGRWQVPVAILAIGVAAYALVSMRPPPKEIQFDALLADIRFLMEKEAYYDATNAAANLIEMTPELPAGQRAALHDVMAESIFLVEQKREAANLDNVKLLLEHQAQAQSLGFRPTARAALRAGQAHEWLRESNAAIEEYRLALERKPTSTEDRRRVLQSLVRLLDGRPWADEERRAAIDALLAEEGVSSAYVWWALQHALQEAFDRGEPARAREMLERHAERFKRSDLKGYHDFLWAWLEISEGQFESAAPRVDWVDEWLKTNSRLDPEMDRAGFLPAMNLWLRGRLHLAEYRPQEALGVLERVLTMTGQGTLFVDTTIDMARAEALLERHDSARRTIRDGLGRVSRDVATFEVAVPRSRRLMLELAEARRRLDDAENAVEYLAMALELTGSNDRVARLDLIERLGNECRVASEAAAVEAGRRQLLVRAGDYFGQAAELCGDDEARRANMLWASAQAFEDGGAAGSSLRMLRAFVETVVNDPRVPPAIVQIGQGNAAAGRFEEAVQWYRRLISNFPRLDEQIVRARVLQADSLIMLGEAHYAEAEQTLNELLTDGRVGPQNQVYRDALVMLANLLYDQGRYADAIVRLEEALAFYPDDSARDELRFHLADAYRRSAHALREAQGATAASAAALQESEKRFEKAAELFATFPTREPGPAMEEFADVEGAYAELALFHRGECLFSLNATESLAEALAVYRQAAALYQGRPAALSAQIQIVNILLRQGKATEAARAIERARWLLRSVPDELFAARGDGLDRAYWEKYLNAVSESHLFRGSFADAR